MILIKKLERSIAVKNIIIGSILLVSLPAMAVTGPEQLIRQTSNSVIIEIDANRDTYQGDPQKVHALVDDLVSPHFNFTAMTDLALGIHKDRINAEQKSVIVNEFRLLLVRTYSSALLEYTDQGLIYLPMDGSEAEGMVTVRTQYDLSGGFPIPVDYSMHLGDDGWKVFDVKVDEVSLVANFRSSFARSIKRNGVDGLIKTLHASNQESLDEGNQED
jgi:phospholipid transport system substrate-binding protein